jgi:hypothetical protein
MTIYKESPKKKGYEFLNQNIYSNPQFAEGVKKYAEGGALEGTNYVYVAGNGTSEENGEELKVAYDLAKTMLPSATNRITVIVAPGNYKFLTKFVMDTEFIDLVSLTGNADVIFDLNVEDPFEFDDDTYDVLTISECLLIDVDNVYVKGIKGKFYLSPNFNNYWGEGEDYILPIQVSNDLNIIVENCVGGPFSFGGDFTFGLNSIIVSGTFINCQGNESSFGSHGIASGIFTNCKGSYLSFGGGNIASGIFTDCVSSSDGSFGGYGIANGTFINCQGNESSFGSNNTASGIFTNCTGNSMSFGGNGGIASGTFNNCQSLGYGSFGQNGAASGIFTNCISGNLSFGNNGIASGIFTNCIGGFYSWNTIYLTGQLYYCRLTSDIFPTVSTGGRTYYCIDGNGNTNNQ